MAIAGDDANDVGTVADIVGKLGFTPVVLPTLHAGRVLEPGQRAFGVNLPEQSLRELLAGS